jgi:hypothetical protein
MNKFKSTLIAAMLMAGSSSQAATILTPTDGDVNFLNISTTNVGWAYQLYMFDDSTVINNSLTAAGGLAVPLPSTVGVFGPVGGNYIATNSLANTLVLTGSDQFVLAVLNLNTNVWIEDSGSTSLGANAERITFNYLNANGTLAVLAVDVQVVPVPAAVWLFGSGMIGLLGIASRKSRV